METEDITLFPRWRQAVRDLLNEFKSGDLVPLSWLEDRFGMPTLRDSQKLTADQFRERQFAWLGNVEAFKAELLRDHQVLLQSVRGEGYRWCPPGEQTRVAQADLERDMRKSFRMTALRLKNVRIGELTDDQRQQNVDAIAKLSALRGTVKQIGR